MEAYAKRPRVPLAVTKETILAAIDHGNAAYLRIHCRTTKNTVNKLFANTRDSFATVEKNAAGKKCLVSATTLARAIYRFAAAPTIEAATAHHAIIEALLKQCGVKVSDQKDDFLRFIAVDAWQMARKTPEVRGDPSRHSPLKRRMLLAIQWRSCSWRRTQPGSSRRPASSRPSRPLSVSARRNFTARCSKKRSIWPCWTMRMRWRCACTWRRWAASSEGRW